MSYKMISIDLDGTLLNRETKLSAVNKAAVQKAVSAGRQIVLNSGRGFLSMDTFVRAAELKKEGVYGIAYNGGCVYKTLDFELIFEHRLDAELAKRILASIKTLNTDKASPIVYSGAQLIIEKWDDWTSTYTDFTEATPLMLPYTALSQDISKIIVSGENAELQRIADHLEPFNNEVTVCFSHGSLLEIINIATSKGLAHKALAEYLNIPIAETIAIGDSYNDIPMLEAAGLGIAMANAADEVKAAADYITKLDNHDGGVAEVIEKFLLADIL